jgi:hypothetical protein
MAKSSNKGFLLVLMHCPQNLEDEFNAWYDTEHLPERLAVPGITSAKRFVCLSGHPRYLAMYDLERPEVMDSPDYLKVAHGNSSPWTKRVTSRVQVYRSAGRQVWPGNAVTKTCSRLTLLRFRGLGVEAERQIIAGLEANFASRPQTIQSRLLAHDTGKGIDWLGLVESRAPDEADLDLKPFSATADALDLVNVYAPY